MSDRYDSWIKGMVQRRECENGKLLLFGMIHMDCLMEEDKESRCIFK